MCTCTTDDVPRVCCGAMLETGWGGKVGVDIPGTNYRLLFVLCSLFFVLCPTGFAFAGAGGFWSFEQREYFWKRRGIVQRTNGATKGGTRTPRRHGG